MLGEIEKIIGETLYIKLTFDPKKSQSLLNLYILINDNSNNFIGEIIGIDQNMIEANLIGEYTNGDLIYGVIKKPSLGAKVSLIAKDFIEKLITFPKNIASSLDVALSPFYDSVTIRANINNLFGSHMAIFGSTGSGKSCGFARVIQNLMQKDGLTEKMNLIIFDAYGEYANAFSYLDKNNYAFKMYTTDNTKNTEHISFPTWFLDVDDFALLLGVTKKNQIPIIEKALRNVNLFKLNNENVLKYKNSILASAILDILLSGRPAPQIRDQIFSALSKFNTPDLNLESSIFSPGYTRTLKQCLLIDEHGKINAIELVIEFLQKFITNTSFVTSLPDGSYSFTLEDVLTGLEFALIDEGIWKSDKIFDDVNIIKVRLLNLINSDKKQFFDYQSYVTKDEYIDKLFKTIDGKKAGILNFNINNVDDRFAKVLVKIYSKLIFENTKTSNMRVSKSYNIIIEEAHRYVQNDIDNDILGYNIFERISKEGRKYGVLLSLISQRPCELSETCLSQCSNFLLFKMTHPADLEFVKVTVPSITEEIINKVKTVKPGFAICFGSAFKMPVLVKMQMPNPTPSSDSVNVTKIWYSN